MNNYTYVDESGRHMGGRWRTVAIALGVIIALTLARILAWLMTHRSHDVVAEPTTVTSSNTASSVATSSEATTSTEAQDAPAEYTMDEKCGNQAQAVLSSYTSPAQLYCDGNWMYAGDYPSDHQSLYYWTEAGWKSYDTDGTTGIADYPCYKPTSLKAHGIPDRLTSMLTVCEPESSGTADDEFAWLGPGVQCDGRYILIVESVLVGPGENLFDKAAAGQQKWPGSSVTSGSACSSMRSTVDGKDVYAIYYDAGHSVDKVCALKAKYGGNARSMNNAGDFSDPC